MTAAFATSMACAIAQAAGGVDPALRAYAPQPVAPPRDASYVSPDGAITVVGYNDMKDMLEAMTARFTETHPNVRFNLMLPGTRFAPAAL
ncbi:MAG: hypothetical protein ACM3X5_07750, partial [Bacillota bacterium]